MTDINILHNLTATLLIGAKLAFSLYLGYYILWVAFGESTFDIIDGSLIVYSTILFLKIRKTYVVSDIKDPKIESATSATSWGFGRLQFADYKSAILKFNYRGKTVTLGKDIADFDASKLKSWIS